MKRPLIIALAGAVALPALAQDTSQDWDMLRDPRNRLLMAYTEFDNGIGIATRCADGGFEAILTGLPPAGEATRRPLRIAFGDEALSESLWNVAVNDTVAVSDLPAPFARNLREGGRLRVMVPGGAADGRNLLYDLQLPASSTSIDETLATCGRPLTDPRDAELEALPEGGLPASLAWSRQLRPNFPSPIRYGRGFAVATCVTNGDGSLRDCTIETEHPRDGGFGQAVLNAARRARLSNIADPGLPVPTLRVLFRTTFGLDGDQTREDEAARRDQRERERERRAAERTPAG